MAPWLIRRGKRCVQDAEDAEDAEGRGLRWWPRFCWNFWRSKLFGAVFATSLLALESSRVEAVDTGKEGRSDQPAQPAYLLPTLGLALLGNLVEGLVFSAAQAAEEGTTLSMHVPATGTFDTGKVRLDVTMCGVSFPFIFISPCIFNVINGYLYFYLQRARPLLSRMRSVHVICVAGSSGLRYKVLHM